MFWCSNWQSVTTTPKVLIRSLMEKICTSCILKPSLTAPFASESGLKLYSLFFKPHPRSLDFFPACLPETAESAPFLPCVSSLSFRRNPCCWVKNCLLSLFPIQNWLPVHVRQAFNLLQSSIQIMLFLPGIQLSFPICSYWMRNSGSYKALWGSGRVSSVVFGSHCASSWGQASKNCNVFEEVIWNVKIMSQSCLICNCLLSNSFFDGRMVLYMLSISRQSCSGEFYSWHVVNKGHFMNLIQYVKPHPVFLAHESSAGDYHLHLSIISISRFW